MLTLAHFIIINYMFLAEEVIRIRSLINVKGLILKKDNGNELLQCIKKEVPLPVYYLGRESIFLEDFVDQKEPKK